MIFIKRTFIQKLVSLALVLAFLVCVTQAATADVAIGSANNADNTRSLSWPTKWPLSANPVKFHNDLGNTEDTIYLSDYATQVGNAMSTWNSVGLVQLQQVFTGSESSGSYKIYWDEDLESGVLGNTRFYEGAPSFIGITVDLRLNPDEPWAIGAVSGCYDVETIVLHELGHVLGITHCHEKNTTCVYTSGCQYFVMNPYAYTYWTKRNLHSTDIARYRSKYS